MTTGLEVDIWVAGSAGTHLGVIRTYGNYRESRREKQGSAALSGKAK